MKNALIVLVERLSFGRVRGMHTLYCQNSLRWWWTPYSFTEYFGAGGWIFLSPRWMVEKFFTESRRRSAVPYIPAP